MDRFWLLLHFVWLSAEDIREGELSMAVIAELGITGIIRAVRTGTAVEWVPGIILLFVGYATKEGIGYGDGWFVLALGAWLPLFCLLRVLGLGFLYCVIAAAVLGRKELPFVPFLAAAYITGEWL